MTTRINIPKIVEDLIKTFKTIEVSKDKIVEIISYELNVDELVGHYIYYAFQTQTLRSSKWTMEETNLYSVVVDDNVMYSNLTKESAKIKAEKLEKEGYQPELLKIVKKGDE